jgi:hypothetical protein
MLRASFASALQLKQLLATYGGMHFMRTKGSSFKFIGFAAIAAMAALAVSPASSQVRFDDWDLHEGGMHPADFTVLGSKWKPGPGAAEFGNYGTPGSATYSVIAAGLAAETGAGHPVGALTTSLGALIGTASSVEEIAMINAAFNVWAAVANISNLGMVADGGGPFGGLGPASGVGDIRVGAMAYTPGSGVLAHAYQPAVDGMFFDGSIGGDMHMNTGFLWADDATDTNADSDYDLFTVILHELGHSLGLGHTGIAGSVMFPFYGGAMRTLTADDIAGIQFVYGARALDVPEPSTYLAMGMGIVGVFAFRRRSVRKAAK